VEHIRELGSSRNGTGLDGQLRHASQNHELMGIQRFPKWCARPRRFAWPPMVTGASSTGMAASGRLPPILDHMLRIIHSTLHVSRRSSAWRLVTITRYSPGMDQGGYVTRIRTSRAPTASWVAPRLVSASRSMLPVTRRVGAERRGHRASLSTQVGTVLTPCRACRADSALRWIGLATPSLSRPIRSIGYPPPAIRADVSRKARDREARARS
jgi:hypothetical protein